jgi:hypothetical protein
MDQPLTPTMVVPEFNQADWVADDLVAQITKLTKENAVLRSQIAQLDGVIKANADKLGLVVAEDGSMSTVAPPKPPRAQRRQAARKSPVKE